MSSSVVARTLRNFQCSHLFGTTVKDGVYPITIGILADIKKKEERKMLNQKRERGLGGNCRRS